MTRLAKSADDICQEIIAQRDAARTVARLARRDADGWEAFAQEQIALLATALDEARADADALAELLRDATSTECNGPGCKSCAIFDALYRHDALVAKR